MGAKKQAVDVADYVDFLLSQPPMKEVREIDQATALAVARRLREIANAHDSRETRRLADQIWMLPLRHAAGDVAQRHKCRDFLKAFRGIYLAPDLCDAALQLLERPMPEDLGRLPQAPQDEWLQYRSDSGRAQYIRRQRKTNPPPDDRTSRLFEAYCALKEAGCRTPAAFLAHRLGWASNRVEMRLKPRKKQTPEAWPDSFWRMIFWLSLDPSNREIRPLPEEQPFEFRWSG